MMFIKFYILFLIIFAHLVKLLKIIKERRIWQNLFAIKKSMDKDKNLKNENKDSNMDAQSLQEQGYKINSSNSNPKPKPADEHSNTESVNDTNNSTSNSNTFQLDLAVLNEVSKIAKMGMDSISYLAPKVSDKEMRKVLVAMYSQYGNTQSQINQHFEKYGEIPDSTPFKDKMMSFAGVQFNTLRDRSNSHIAEIMIQGTLMGVIECQKILNCGLDVQKSTTDLLKDFNKFQRENINKLNAFL